MTSLTIDRMEVTDTATGESAADIRQGSEAAWLADVRRWERGDRG